jgi:hypothetical protein
VRNERAQVLGQLAKGGGNLAALTCAAAEESHCRGFATVRQWVAGPYGVLQACCRRTGAHAMAAHMQMTAAASPSHSPDSACVRRRACALRKAPSRNISCLSRPPKSGVTRLQDESRGGGGGVSW